MPLASLPLSRGSAIHGFVLSPQVGLAVATLLWAGNFVVGRSLRGVIDPLELNFWRWLVALVVLLPFTAAGLASQWRILRRHLGLVLALGLTGIALPHACIYTALQTTSAVNALLLLNLAPLLMAWGAAVFFGQSMKRWQWLGMAVSLSGAVTLIVGGSVDALLALKPGRGDLWMMPAVAGAAAHVLMLKRTPPGVTQGPLLTASVVAALALMGPVLLWRGDLAVPSGGQVLASLGYIGVMASALAFFLWNRGVARVGPGRAAPYMYLMGRCCRMASSVRRCRASRSLAAAWSCWAFGWPGRGRRRCLSRAAARSPPRSTPWRWRG